MTIEERFSMFDKEYLKFNRIENPLSTRPDMHAFIMLDRIFPGTGDMVSSAEHDEIFLGIVPDGGVLTDDQICDLVRCGVRYDEEAFCLFV
jgi:hypothetical protein